ncbi:MAG: hypothetical protein JSU70_13800 [Phycisphaerales bacterium]|nr:MAG: hypothetical protein JSU70_13800 [Phycisphaerales bacterium]
MDTSGPHSVAARSMSRRGFLGGVGAVASLGSIVLATASSKARADEARRLNPISAYPFPQGKTLRVQPALMFSVEQHREKDSWRSYGGLRTRNDVENEIRRIEKELGTMVRGADFPVEIQPLIRVEDEDQARQVARAETDAILLFAASGGTNLLNAIASSDTPSVVFIRHRSGPFYLWYEIIHWRFLRRNDDTFDVQNVDIDDVVVDDYGRVLRRLRALYGLKNAKGTAMLAIGGLLAYSEPAQKRGPEHAKELWGYRIETVTEEEFAGRLARARSDAELLEAANQKADALLALPNVTLQTQRKFVFNSFLALAVCEQLMQETGATNFGFARCMGRPVIEMLDTPPCLILSLANDAGYTAYCHADLSHTVPGVLMRWIAGRPTFVCNSHFPHDGLFTVAHCAAPRRMNGQDYEPTTLMTHYESDYGVATKVEYPRDQVVSVVIPNLRCTKWQAFRGRILESPSYQACRSQMEISIDGDGSRLAAEMEGFHAQIVYGDYLLEIGYALKKLGAVEWQCYSDTELSPDSRSQST